MNKLPTEDCLQTKCNFWIDQWFCPEMLSLPCLWISLILDFLERNGPKNHLLWPWWLMLACSEDLTWQHGNYILFLEWWTQAFGQWVRTGTANNFVAPFFKMNFVAFLRNEIILSAKTGPQSNLTLLFRNYILFASSLQWEVFLSDTMQPLWHLVQLLFVCL